MGNKMGDKFIFRLRNRNDEIVGFEKWYSGHINNITGLYEAEPKWLYSTDAVYWSSVRAITHRYKDQSTGLKDKNGQLIYEGDVVQCCYWFFDGEEVDEHFKARVGFKDGCFTLEGIKSKFYSDYTGEKEGEGTCWIGSIDFCDADYQIIGNIYENPKLLKQTDPKQHIPK